MPTNVHTAAVEHRVGRGNGSMLVSGNNAAPQLEKATVRNYYRSGIEWLGNHYIICQDQSLKLAAPRRLSQVRSLLRLRGAAERPGRHLRLRARIRTRSQMPIPQPVNSWGVQSTRNILNYGTDRSDGQRAFLRRAARVVRKKIAGLCPEGTRHR